MNAETFNALYEVGIPVFAYPGARPPKAARKLITRTRSRAWVADHGKSVVMVDGLVGWISLSHVDVAPEGEWEAAKAAEGAVTEQAPKDTLPAWLYQRFAVIHGAPPWDRTTDSDRSYWEHQARAVRRAVERGGFKAEAATS